ncbi:MAG: alpha/beta fold hydrolase [Acidimicrobiia bacterium]
MTAPAPLVLVHGGGHGSWCWEPLRAHLEAPVLAVDLPPRSIRGGEGRHADVPELATLTIGDFAAAVLADVDAAGHDRFVLVGHSMGGLTISEVARRAPTRVAHLVYVSAIVPPEGLSAVEAMPVELRQPTRAAIDAHRDGGANPVGGLDDTALRFMFCNDMDEDQTRFVLDNAGTEVAVALAEPAWRAGIPAELPKTYVKLLRDQSLPPELQDNLISNLEASPGGAVEVVTLDAGHDVMISRPRALAPVLNRIAAGPPEVA